MNNTANPNRQLLVNNPELIPSYGKDTVSELQNLMKHTSFDENTNPNDIKRAGQLHAQLIQIKATLSELTLVCEQDDLNNAIDRYTQIKDFEAIVATFINHLIDSVKAKDISTHMAITTPYLKLPHTYTSDDLKVIRVQSKGRHLKSNLEDLTKETKSNSPSDLPSKYYFNIPKNLGSTQFNKEVERLHFFDKWSAKYYQLRTNATNKYLIGSEHMIAVTGLLGIPVTSFDAEVIGVPAFTTISLIGLAIATPATMFKMYANGRDQVDMIEGEGFSTDDQGYMYNEDTLHKFIEYTIDNPDEQSELFESMRFGLQMLSFDTPELAKAMFDFNPNTSISTKYTEFDLHHLQATRAWLIELIPFLEVTWNMETNSFDKELSGDPKVKQAAVLLIDRYKKLTINPAKSQLLALEHLENEHQNELKSRKQEETIDLILKRYSD